MLKYKWIHNRRKQLDKNGKAPLHLYVYNVKKKYFHTQVFLRPTEWDGSKVLRHSDKLNINKKILDYESYLDAIGNQSKPIELVVKELSMIRDGIKESNLVIEYVKKKLPTNLKQSTVKQHLILHGYLERFDSGLQFSHLTYTRLNQFKKYLSKQNDRRYKTTKVQLSANYVASMLIILNSYINEAIRDGKLDSNALELVKKDKTVTKKEYLTMQEVERVAKVDVSSRAKGVQFIHKLFLFDCYTGLRVSDLERIHPSNLNGGILTIEPLKTEKNKTKVVLDLNFLFWGRALDLIKEFDLPVKIRGKSHQHIQDFIDAAGIDKKIGWHSARHSFAMNLLAEGIPLLAVQKALGHKSIQTTEIYAKMTSETMNDAMKKGFMKVG